MFVILSDYHGPRALLEIPEGLDVEALRAEYEGALDPGPNPFAHCTPAQDAWLEKVWARQEALAAKYGGDRDEDGVAVHYSPLTFAGWLEQEKGAKRISFAEHLMAEFD